MEPIAHSQHAGNTSILRELEMAVNDEILAAYQYWTAYNMTKGPGKYDADPIFEEHMNEEWEHVELLAERIKELGGSFVTDTNKIRSNAAPWFPIESGDVKYLAQHIYDAEDRAAAKYERLAALTRDDDPGTYKIILQILTTEQEHRYELHKLKESLF